MPTKFVTLLAMDTIQVIFYHSSTVPFLRTIKITRDQISQLKNSSERMILYLNQDS